MSGHNVPLPRHRYVFVRSSFVLSPREKRDDSFLSAVWLGVSSTPGRMLGCHVLLDSGALILDLPLHALAATDRPHAQATPRQAQGWDCFGWQMEAVEYPFLADLPVQTLRDKFRGRYWFSVDWIGDGYSMEPGQHKQLHVIACDAGHLIAVPQDDLRFDDPSFVDTQAALPPIQRQRTIYRAEQGFTPQAADREPWVPTVGPQWGIAIPHDPETDLTPSEET